MEDPVVADALLDSGVLDLVDIIRCYGLNSDWRAKISERVSTSAPQPPRTKESPSRLYAFPSPEQLSLWIHPIPCPASFLKFTFYSLAVACACACACACARAPGILPRHGITLHGAEPRGCKQGSRNLIAFEQNHGGHWSPAAGPHRPSKVCRSARKSRILCACLQAASVAR
jgi:hypothetical protein